MADGNNRDSLVFHEADRRQKGIGTQRGGLLMTIAVDFDGTIVTHAYPAIGKPIPFAIDTLRRLQSEGGHQLILWSCREGQLLQEAIDYCHERGLDFYAVNSNFPDEPQDGLGARKLTVELFIDDRNLGGLPDWGVIYQMVMSGNPFRPFGEQTYYTSQETHENRKPAKKGLWKLLFGK